MNLTHRRGIVPVKAFAEERRPAAGRWYEIRNAGDVEAADMWIYDEISFWGVSADQFRQDLAAITAPRINLHITSPGGDVFDGVAIYNSIRQHPAYVTARVDGLAASIASVIVQAADERVMLKHSQMMVHDAWGLCVGNARDMLDAAALLEKQNAVIAGIYHERTRGGAAKLDKIRKAMADETWMTAEEAVQFGLADRVEAPKFQAEPPAASDPPAEPPPADEADGPTDGPVDNEDASVDDVWDKLRRRLLEPDVEELFA